MSTFHEEAAMSHGAENPTWEVVFVENLTSCERHVEVGATDYQQAINKAAQRLNMDLSKPEGTYYFTRCTRTSAPTTSEVAESARLFGAWYEQGAWRFPTVHAKDQFQRQVGL